MAEYAKCMLVGLNVYQSKIVHNAKASCGTLIERIAHG